MPPTFLATVGQRPSAVTVALDILKKQYNYEHVGFIVTDPILSDISEEYDTLKEVVRRHHSDIDITEHIVCDEEDNPLVDITDAYTAEQYFMSVLLILKQYREQGINIHFLVAGGRKAMSIYATLAASLVFGSMDHVYTILSSPEFISDNYYNMPPERHKDVQIIHLPTLPSRLLPYTLAGIEIGDILQQMRNPREQFLKSLSPRERELADTLYQHQYASYKELGHLLGVSSRTIENQLSSIYSKMNPYFELHKNKQKKSALIDVMSGRI